MPNDFEYMRLRRHFKEAGEDLTAKTLPAIRYAIVRTLHMSEPPREAWAKEAWDIARKIEVKSRIA